LLRSLIKPPDHQGTELRRRKQIIAPLPRRIQLYHCLIQIRAHPAHQPGRRHQLSQRLPQRRPDPDPGLGAANRRQGHLGRERPSGQPDRAAAALTSSNSSSVGENCTTFGRDSACLDRRRLDALATPVTLTHSDPCREAFLIGAMPGPDQRRPLARPCHCLSLDRARSRDKQWL
jgi:hypothetical protein